MSSLRGKSLRLLTARQREVVRMLAEGKTMKEAASILGVPWRTVAFHKNKVIEHLASTPRRRTTVHRQGLQGVHSDLGHDARPSVAFLSAIERQD